MGDLEEIRRALVRLEEAAGFAQYRRDLGPIERRLQAKLKAAFRTEGKRYRARLDRVAKKWPHGLTDAEEALELPGFDWLVILESVQASTRDLYEGPVSAAHVEAYRRGIRSAAVALKYDLDFDLLNPRAASYLTGRAAANVAGIQATTRREIARILEKGFAEGWSYSRVAGEISRRYERFAVGVPQEHLRSRAELIAVQESAEAYGQGNLDGAREIDAAGIGMEKSWGTAGDPRVDQPCRDNEAAGWIGIDEAFPTGAQREPDHIACRCFVRYRRRELEAAA